MMEFVKFMNSSTGRILRIVIGASLLVLGLFAVKDTGAIVLDILGVLFMLSGFLDICALSVLFGYPLQGDATRRKIAEQERRS